ncbi:hypothetical protein BDW02DRAFT_574834 [Decorospora gaudefroyi]|uniref:Uncharacterized protein n=1 Tax=Decorospora gaudefroyi TaxID=184978 RepID=A0A6A5K213_9PLEO|nr:hypothetical protein BDW02DRAFT_574834 [Decorospora gaudefroyi]
MDCLIYRLEFHLPYLTLEDADRRPTLLVEVKTCDDIRRRGKATGDHVLSDNDFAGAPEKTEHDSPTKHTRDLLGDVAMRQECQKGSGRRLIWIAEGSAAKSVSEALRRADVDLDEQSDAQRWALESTYGVINLQSHQRTFLDSCVLAVGQGGWWWILRNYETSRDHTGSNTAASLTYKDMLRNPPTGLFVIAALVYGILAMLQYHINRADYFQQLCLVSGLAAGFLLSPSIPFTMPGSPISLYTFAATTSMALACSACGHWTWRTFFSRREARLEAKIAEWGDDARDIEKDTHVIRFCEVA